MTLPALATLWPALSGFLTGLLIVLFAAIAIWAWSGARRDSFEAAARLPLEEDDALSGPTQGARAP